MATPLTEPLRAFGAVLRNRDLRRLQLAEAGSGLGQWLFGVAFAVYTYQEGGAALVGLAGFLRLAPAAVAAPLLSVLADRHPRRTVLVACELTRAVLVAGVAVAITLDGPVAAVLVLLALNAIVATVFRPARCALVPSLTRTPEELTAANVASGTIESLTMFAGPALGGLLLIASSVEVVFLATTGALLWSAGLASGIRVAGGAGAEDGPESAAAAPGFAAEGLAGFRAIGADPGLRVVIGMLGAQTLVAGGLNVLVVVTALDVLHRETSWVGFLGAAIGVGGVAGAAVAAALVGRRLSRSFALSIALWGAPLIAVGLVASPAVALLAMGAIGVANTIGDVSGLTLIQRLTPDRVMGRVMGVLESLVVGTIAVGSLLVSAVVETFGAEAALIATGAFLPLVTLACLPALRRVDARGEIPGVALDLLRGLPIFAPLPTPTLELLARGLRPCTLAAGDALFAQGDPGDAFYVVASGTLAAHVDGREVATLGPGEGLGEIALLHDIPRTATIVAREPAELLALEREDFLAAVTGHSESARSADEVVATRLARARPALAAL